MSSSVGIISIMSSDTYNNNLNLAVAKTSSFSGCSLTCIHALFNYTADGFVTAGCSVLT